MKLRMMHSIFGVIVFCSLTGIVSDECQMFMTSSYDDQIGIVVGKIDRCEAHENAKSILTFHFSFSKEVHT